MKRAWLERVVRGIGLAVFTPLVCRGDVMSGSHPSADVSHMPSVLPWLA